MPLKILAEQVSIGQGVSFGENVTISGPRGMNAKIVLIGDGAVIEDGVVIFAEKVRIGIGAVVQKNFVIEVDADAPENSFIVLGDKSFLGADGHAITGGLFVGDYTRLHNHIFIHGPGEIHIGHNGWVGGHCVLDGQGGLFIDDNVGVGAQSQLWSHMQFGDVLAGCRWFSKKSLVIEQDVWFVGHCIVSPIRAYRRSMALAGSVVTRDMEENHVYAGVPARDVTSNMGPQFVDSPPEVRMDRMKQYLEEFYAAHPEFRERTLLPVLKYDDRLDAGITQFHLMDRTYTRRRTDQELEFLSWVTPVKAKFLPHDWTSPLIELDKMSK